jgi:hypothetical protein
MAAGGAKGAVFKAVVLSNTFSLMGDERMARRFLSALAVADVGAR